MIFYEKLNKTMAKKIMVKVFAFMALFWILIWIVGTALLIIFWNNSSPTTEAITSEQLQELINSWESNELDDTAWIWEIINVSATWAEQ